MQILVFDDAILARLREVRAHAECHIFTRTDQADMMAYKREPVGGLDAYICKLPFGVELVLTLEEHPGAWARHVSISVVGQYPDPALAQALMPLLGFTRPLDECIVNRVVHPVVNLHYLSIKQVLDEYPFKDYPWALTVPINES